MRGKQIRMQHVREVLRLRSARAQADPTAAMKLRTWGASIASARATAQMDNSAGLGRGALARARSATRLATAEAGANVNRSVSSAMSAQALRLEIRYFEKRLFLSISS
jgi:hypothetical protein